MSNQRQNALENRVTTNNENCDTGDICEFSVNMDSIQQLSLTSLINRMATDKTTESWDAMYSVSITKLNEVLAHKHESGKAIAGNVSCTLDISGVPVGSNFNFGVPTLSFNSVNGGHATLTMPIEKGSYTINKEINYPILPGTKMIVSAPLSSIQGEDGPITPQNKVVTFEQGKDDTHHIFLDFSDLTKLDISGEGANKTVINYAANSLKSCLVSHYNAIDYSLTSVNNQMNPSDINVTPESFVFTTYGSGNSAVLSVYVQTGLTGSIGNNQDLHFSPGPNQDNILPIPVGYDMSFILSYEAYVSYLTKQFSSVPNIGYSVGKSQDSGAAGIYAQINYVKFDGHNCATNHDGGYCYFSEIKKANGNFPESCDYVTRSIDNFGKNNPLIFQFGENNLQDLQISLTSKTESDCKEKGFFSDHKCGTVTLMTMISKNVAIPVDKSGIGAFNISLSKDDYQHHLSTDARKCSCQCEKVDLNEHTLPGFGIFKFEDLNFLPTTNILVPLGDLSFAEQAGVHFPKDVVLVGQVDIS